MTDTPFTMSIETSEGVPAEQHGFHLGTDERLARELVVERFHGRIKAGLPTLTIALMRNRKVVDVYDGRWFSDIVEDDQPLTFKLPITKDSV